MPLFQPSVVKKYIQDLDKVAIQKLFAKFTEFFGNAERQQNIRELKEEQFQEGFLRNLFVDILGYTINPEPNYNLLTEQKNEKDSKKADGAILKQTENETNVIAVIELKGTDTTDLAKVENQAFGYKNNQKSCVYVITSNFEKLRFYIDNAIDFEEFNLFSLSEEQFQLMFLCLAKDNLLNNVPQRIKEASVSQEDQITKKLYTDYSAFKKVLFANITELNPEFDKLTLFKKTQKLLDRFLFIFFAEDRLLLPPNSIRAIVEQWEKLKELDEYKPLYERFIKYFGYLNVGHKGQNFDIFAYNGGLFLPDDILDNIKIDDELLREHTIKLSNYDFDTEVDVNILGHIFEHSLNEIEEVQSELEGKAIDSNKSKRKKDGVYYTPKYITKYIVENTVGALCSEKKKELEINEDEIVISNRKNKKKELLDKIDIYRNWLLKLTICDPACGSGAFLNQALDFLINEHKKLDELIARITNSPIVFSDIENSILENNIFGVDINEEAVEIAKLSLWLKTAKKGRKLSKISNNIKCGNSLIDDPEVAGEKAFNWFVEFPQVFPFYRDKDKHTNDNIKKDIIRLGLLNYPDQGDFNYTDEISEPVYSYKPGSKGFEKYGFDVVIGNPPYGSVLAENEKKFVQDKYICYKGNFDIYSAFIQAAFNLLKDGGLWAFINPVSWQSGENYFNVRDYLSKNGKLEIAIKLPYDVFADAYVDTGIYIVQKKIEADYLSRVYEFPIRTKYTGDLKTDINYTLLPKNYWMELPSLRLTLSPKYYELVKKVNTNVILLNSISKSIRGVLPRDEDVFYESAPDLKMYFVGSLNRYYSTKDFIWLNYGDHLKEKPKDFSFFQGDRILIRRIISRQFRIMASYFNQEFVNKKDYYNVKITNNSFNTKYILAIICSRLISFLKTKGATTATKDDFAQLSLSELRETPIKPISIIEQKTFIEKVDKIISLNKELQDASKKFQRTIQRKFSLVDLPGKLQDWYLHTYQEFIKELGKKKIKLSLAEEAEWEEYFLTEAKKALELKAKIEATDKEIDQMVYELYGLTEEEIRVVEEGEASI